MEKTFTLSIKGTPSDDERSAVERGLLMHAYTLGIEQAEPRPLTVLLQDQSGALAGGLIGNCIWGWLNIRLLWVDESLRGKGHGTQILRAAEEEAAQRGCHHACLETFNMDALRFYQREGYTTYGALPDYPKGFTRYSMAKSIGGK
ncbi:MAG: GNAT family N-acetyltransferase [Polyangiaceae bacterium]|nr:GNAT family N-acetyltransferase [Polyangiaceae bacterium]